MSKASTDPGEEGLDPPPQQGTEELQHQFEQQQSMIAQLKGAVQTSKQQIATTEKEIEECAAKLVNIKSRRKALKISSKNSATKRTSVEGGGVERGEAIEGASIMVPGTPLREETVEMESAKKEVRKGSKSSEKTEKAKLLRKKLEENRLRFEQRGKEMSENKKGIEEMVENLRMQLEERDQVIQSLQKGLESTPKTVIPATELKIETAQVFPDAIMSKQSDQREMYAQLVYKDNKIVELNNRIMELELNVLDLQENLKEKDAVIDARTKAITLMSEDMSRKSKTTLDTLDDTREQMRLMQNNFITLETRMKDENEQLKKRLEEKDRKFKYVEESHKKLESVRFELTTCIAELQEKVVHLQTMNTALQKQGEDSRKSRESRGEKEDRVEELLRTLDESNRQMLKIKAQHKNKVKSLTKQIESLKKVSESSDEILRLQQRVAELEEDKGNLQLHLVDFDELKATENSWKERIQELEEKVKQQNEDLDSHVRALSQLEAEKLNLIEDLQTERLQVAELGTVLKASKSRITEVENLKVSAEMKAVELEELVDLLTQEKNSVLQENKILTDDRNEYKQLLDSLQQEKNELLEEITTLQTLLKENNPGDTDSNRSEFQMVSSNNSDEEKWKRLPTPEESPTEEKHVKDSSNVELYVKLLESELEDARRVIAEEKDTIHDLKAKLESKEDEIEMHLEVISRLEQLGREVVSEDSAGDVNKISEILKELNEMTGDLEEWKQRCSEVEDRLKCLEDEKVSLQKKLEEVTDENSLLNSQLNLQKQVSEELVSKLKEKNKIISEKEEVIKNLEKLQANKSYDVSDCIKPEEISSDNNAESEIISLTEQIGNLKKLCLDYENEIAEKDAELLQIKLKLDEKQKENISVEQTLEVVDKSSPSKHLQDELKEKEIMLEYLKDECQELKTSVENLKMCIAERMHNEGEIGDSNRVHELELLLKEKDNLLAEKEGELEKAKEKSKTLAEKVKKVAVNLKAKTVVLQNLEEKEKKYLSDIQEKDETISKLTFEIQKVSDEREIWRLQCEEKDKSIVGLSEKIELNIQSQGSKIEELILRNKELVVINENLTSDFSAMSGKLMAESQEAEVNKNKLVTHISELEKELRILKEDLGSKIAEINYLRSECGKINEVEECRMQNEQKMISEIMKKDEELAELSSKIDDHFKTIEMKNQELENTTLRHRELEQIIVTKDMQVTALEDRVSYLQNAWPALQAKLQEREAFIESLEQELAQSNARQQHLEEGLSFIEDRRRSLESKFAALGEQLQESDRIKEEAEEHEGELASRLAALASSEEMLRKRLENLNERNVELSQKLSEMSLENEDLKKNIANSDNNLKIANKEMERLLTCESAHLLALETIERLEDELKKRTVEFERSTKEKEQKTHQHVEMLETDLKNLSQQLEILESEKRAVMEHCENLNDVKMNLEDDLSTLQEKVDSCQTRILQMERMYNDKEMELKSVLNEKQKEVEELSKKIQQLERMFNDKEMELISVSNVKQKEVEELRKKIQQLENNLEKSATSVVKSVGMQTQESSGNKNVVDLKSELENVTKLLAQKELEIQSYQNRLLQLQFGSDGTKPSTSEDQSVLRKQLENSIHEMQEKMMIKDHQLEEFRVMMESANTEMGKTQLQLANSCKKIEEMSFEMCHLHEIVKDKDKQLQEQMIQISQNTNSDKLSQQLTSVNMDFESQFSTLKDKINVLNQELIREKAKNVVSDILSSAQICAQERRDGQQLSSSLADERSTVQFCENISFSLSKSDEEPVQKEQSNIMDVSYPHILSSSSSTIVNLSEVDSMKQSEIHASEKADSSYQVTNETNTNQELVEKLGDLRAELDTVKGERTQAILKIEELEIEVHRLHDVEKELNVIRNKLQELTSRQMIMGDSNELFSKESSVESEFFGESCTQKVVTFANENKQLISPEELQEETQYMGSEQQASAPKPAESAEQAWTVEILDEGEGWGWGTEEARLEEEHMERQKAALTMSPPLGNELQQHVIELENQIQLLEKERNKIMEELKASQIRSGKMLKKLKDLKLKNESLMRENQELAMKKSNDFGSLDLAIEEELKIRIDSLEKELKECKGERDAANMEKEGLQKRIEVLSATNERLSEREQQGIDVEYWQIKTKELNNQIESLQWRIEELMEERHTENLGNKTSGIEDLQEQITALAADNEQLQSMLEEQRNMRVVAETALKELQQYTSSKEAIFLQEVDIKENYMTLRENYDLLCKEISDLRSHTGHDSVIAENAALRENYDVLSRELQQLRSSANSDIMAAEYASMRNNYESLYNELEQLRSQVDISHTLQANYESLQMAHDKLINDMNHLQKEYFSLTEKYEGIVKEKCQLENASLDKTNSLQEKIELQNQLENEKVKLVTKYEQLSSEFSVISNELQLLKNEIEKYKNAIVDMIEEKRKLGQENKVLNEKYETLRSSIKESPSKFTNEKEANVVQVEETFQPIQLFSQMSTESSSDLFSSISVPVQDPSTEVLSSASLPVHMSDLEKEVAEYKMRIVELEEIKQQKIEELRVLREMFTYEQQEWANIEQNLSKKIESLEKELEEMREAASQEAENTYYAREDVMAKDFELSAVKSQLSSTEEMLSAAQMKLNDLDSQLKQKGKECLAMNEDQETMIQQIIASKEEEISKLNEMLNLNQQKQEEVLFSKEKDIENLKLQIADREKEITNLLQMKDQDLQNLKIQMLEIEQKAIAEAGEKDQTIQLLHSKLAENDIQIQILSQALKEKEHQVKELQEVLEAREDEIREAVIQIRDRNIEIQRLRQVNDGAQLVDTATQNTVDMSDQTENQAESSQNEQSELDFALYMVHQRDVRCEELTLELMQLLEERDTLQLRLSTAIRINEDLRKKINTTSSSSSPVRVPPEKPSELDTSNSAQINEISQNVLAPINPEPVTNTASEEASEDLKVLADKLSQLHSVDYRRDVTIQDERAQRHSEQLMLLQPRAPGVLVESNYTLSRDVQSPSTVLMNWIWGRSTPKVMHI